jgi:hypothetical protein
MGRSVSTRTTNRLVFWRVSITCAWLHRSHNRFSGRPHALQTLLGFLDGTLGTPSHLKRYRAFSCFRRCREPKKGRHQIARFTFKDRTMSRNDLFRNTQHPVIRLVRSLPLDAPLRPVAARACIKSHVFVRAGPVL